MKRNETGAGQVGLMWVISLVVIILALAGMSYVVFKDLADLEVKYDKAVKTSDERFEQAQKIGEEMAVLSKAVGFRDDDSAASSSVDAITDKLTMLRDQFPDNVSKDTQTLDQAIDAIVAAHGSLERQLAEAKQNFESEVELRRTAESNINTIEQEKDTQIAELQAQVNDEQQRAARQREEDDGRISTLRGQLDAAESAARETENRLNTETERLNNEITMLNARIASQARKLEVLREADLPDGLVVSAMSGSDLVYIDIGKKDGLRRGTKFKVFRYGKGGELLHKGLIEVRDIELDSAQCGVLSVNDQFDPIVKGDVLVNPTFSRNKEKVFYFLGDFPASYSKDFVKSRLTVLGSKVTELLDADTDFLVLGQKEQGDDAVELTETPEFKLASKMGVQIYRLKELVEYIKY